jgi:hypothetical protein
VALSLTRNFKFDFEPELRLGTARPPAARAMITMIESPPAASGRDPGRDHKTELGLGLSAPEPGCLTVLNCAMIINLKFYHDHADGGVRVAAGSGAAGAAGSLTLHDLRLGLGPGGPGPRSDYAVTIQISARGRSDRHSGSG